MIIEHNMFTNPIANNTIIPLTKGVNSFINAYGNLPTMSQFITMISTYFHV